MQQALGAARYARVVAQAAMLNLPIDIEQLAVLRPGWSR